MIQIIKKTYCIEFELLSNHCGNTNTLIKLHDKIELTSSVPVRVPSFYTPLFGVFFFMIIQYIF